MTKKTHPKDYTTQELFDWIMKKDSADDADNMIESIVLALMKPDDTEDKKNELEINIRSNLAYMGGYYSTKHRIKIEELVNTPHPIFGWAKDGVPTAEEAYLMGLQMGEKARNSTL